MSIKYLIFDFNGTIIDDVDLSVECINKCIEKYLNRNIITKEEYQNLFTFPVKKYYEDVGFDFNKLNWEEVGSFWMNYYMNNYQKCKVYDGIIDLLKSNKEKGIKNIIISASRKDYLLRQLKDLKVLEYFDEILGIDNIYAESKVKIALNFIKDKNKDECLMLGDTIHDKEVADAMGIECFLLASGHQNKNKLLEVSDKVYDNIKEVKL